MLTIRNFVFNAFQENTIVVFDETRQAVIIDPGCYESFEKSELDQFISGEQLTVALILNTHCHVDHVLGNFYARERYKVPLLIPEKEEPGLRAVRSYAGNYGFPLYQEAQPDGFLGTSIQFGKTTLDVLLLPGHAPGHVGFLHREQKLIFSGDVLFRRSIGRTDLPGGNYNTLIESIHQKLFTLSDDVVVYPGHGPTTTIGDEKVSNPFCALSLIKG